MIILDLSGIPEEYADIWNEWLDYKKEISDFYKTQKGMELQFSRLRSLSGDNPLMAKAIIYQSIERNWKGLFKLYDEQLNTNQRQANDITSLRNETRLILG